MHQFLGLTSYYQRLISQFAKVASPLHNFTRKDVEFKWTGDRQAAFEALKRKLTQAPILAYPNFKLDFVLETDACVKGLGVALCRCHGDGQLHPTAFAS